MATTETERPEPRTSAAKKPGEVKELPEIREALTHVGELMRLPPKRPGAAAAAAAMLAKAKQFHLNNPKATKVFLPTMAVIMAAIFAAVKLWPKPDLNVPASLQREWVTSHPKYAGNRIAFTSNQVLISIGSNPTTSHPIDAITTTFRGDSTKFVISYIDQGAPVDLEATVVTIPVPRLVFARPEGLVWEPAGK